MVTKKPQPKKPETINGQDQSPAAKKARRLARLAKMKKQGKKRYSDTE